MKSRINFFKNGLLLTQFLVFSHLTATSQNIQIISDTVCFGSLTQLSVSTSVPAQEIDTLKWDLQDNGKYRDALGINIDHVFPRADTFPVRVRIIKTDGTTIDNMNKPGQVVVYPNPEAAFSVKYLCQGQESLVRDQSRPGSKQASYTWKINNVVEPSFQDDTAFSYRFQENSNNLSLTVTNQYGCTNTRENTIKLNPPPTASFTFNKIKCPGDTVWFDNQSSTMGTEGATYFWRYGDSTQEGGTTEPYHRYLYPGNYQISLVAIDDNHCRDTAVENITVNPGSPLSLEQDKDTIYMGQSAILEASGDFVSYAWSTGDSTSSIVVNKEGYYLVQAIDHDGCLSIDSAKVVSLGVYDTKKIIAINNILTSSVMDGINDCLEFDNLATYGKVDLYIYNQWGYLEFECKNYQNDWYGKDKNGKFLETGTYFYVVKAKDITSKGTINILR